MVLNILNEACSTAELSYRAPYCWDDLLEFLSGRIVKGVDHVAQGVYYRTVSIGSAQGWIAVQNSPERCVLQLDFTDSLTSVVPILLDRLRNLFDLDAQPAVIAAHLRQDERLRPSVEEKPGLRVPGAFDGFELAIRAILGQQITVKAATTLSCRFAEALGTAIATPFEELHRLSPLPARVADASVDDIAGLGIISARAKCILLLAKAVVSGELYLGPDNDYDATVKRLLEVPGIGPWTAQYLAMRALRQPDAFPKEDIAIRNRLGHVSAKEAEALSQAWRPWRSYAVMHVWRS
jgi:AraC family transcriptional regulator of adaptative response / DNA-3-methyladenine glycosylase II